MFFLFLLFLLLYFFLSYLLFYSYPWLLHCSLLLSISYFCYFSLSLSFFPVFLFLFITILVLFLFYSYNHFSFHLSFLILFSFLYYSISLSSFILIHSLVVEFAVVFGGIFVLFCFALFCQYLYSSIQDVVGVEPLSQPASWRGDSHQQIDQQQSEPKYNRRVLITHTKEIPRVSS